VKLTRLPGRPRTLRASAFAEPLEDRKLMAVVFGLQANNSLIAFDSATPGTILATVRVKGLQRGETLRGIDFRAATNQLYGLGSTDRLYTIDSSTGAATAVGTTTLAVPLDINQEVGFDFNPAADRIRIVTESNQNLRANPIDGSVADADTNTAGIQFDTPLAYDAADAGTGQNPAILGVAYTNNDTDTATATTLFGIDAERNVLVRQGSPDGTPISPNSGTLFSVGSLGVDPLAIGGFDILTSSTTNSAVAALSTNARQPSQLYTINLDTGAATAIGNIGRGRKPVLGLAFAPAGKSFYVATSRNEILGLNTATPSFVLSRSLVSGLSSRREKIVGIDVRPSTGALFALTDAERVYTINPTTGVATAVGGSLAVALTDRTSYGFDFNPSVDRIRVVNTDGQNLRVNPDTGAVVDFDLADADIDADTPLAFVPVGNEPRIVAAAYSNNIAAGTPTTLFVIDSQRDVLATQGSAGGTATSPNTGQLFEVGATTVNVPDDAGFDIVTTAGIDEAFAVFAQGGRGTTNLYSVNVSTGAFSLVSGLNKKVKSVVGMSFQ
jgi:hypothetical protein